MASYTDVDALIEWIGNEPTETAGGAKKLIKPAITPTMLFPFAAPRVGGDLADAGARAEMEMRVLLWSVERLIGGLSKIGYDSDVDTHLHVVLPGSPNRGRSVATVRTARPRPRWTPWSTAGRPSGTGPSASRWCTLSSAGSAEPASWVDNDPMVDAVEGAGVRTWSTQEMATELLQSCDPGSRVACSRGSARRST